MKSFITPEIKEVLSATHYRPSISIIMPFESRISLKSELIHRLKSTIDKIELELISKYPQEISKMMTKRLRKLISNLDIDNSKKSIIIYMSPLFEKVIYLDIAVEERTIIDESFEIRDLVYSKKQINKFLILLLSGKETKLLLANSNNALRIDLNIPETVFAYVNEVPERVANFSDISDRKEIVIDKFLHHIDKALNEILKIYHLPVFVIGAEKVLGHFKSITKHTDNDFTYVHGNYIDSSISILKDVLAPYISKLVAAKQVNILEMLETAESNNKLAKGINEVWKEASDKKGNLLVVEKNYMIAAQHSDEANKIYKVSEIDNDYSGISDAVDDVIEKVLINGGDIEFVNENVLVDFDRIALIKYY